MASDELGLQCYQRSNDETLSMEAFDEFRFILTAKHGSMERFDSGAVLASLSFNSGYQQLASQPVPAAP